jgi:hypothetical protein
MHTGIGERRVLEIGLGAEAVGHCDQHVRRHLVVQVQPDRRRRIDEVGVAVAVDVERHRRRRHGAGRNRGRLARLERGAGGAAIAQLAGGRGLQQVRATVGVPVDDHGPAADRRRNGRGRERPDEARQARAARTGTQQQLPLAAGRPEPDVGQPVAVEVGQQRLGVAVERVLRHQRTAGRGQHRPATHPGGTGRRRAAGALLREYQQVHAAVAVEVAAADHRAKALRGLDERRARQAHADRHVPEHGLGAEARVADHLVAAPVDRVARRLDVHEVVAPVAIDIGGHQPARWRQIGDAGRAVAVVARRHAAQPLPVVAAARHEQVAPSVAVEVGRDGQARIAVVPGAGADGRVLESVGSATQHHPLATGGVVIREIVEAIAVHVAGDRVGVRADVQRHRHVDAPAGRDRRPAELRRRKARPAGAFLQRAEPAATGGTGHAVAKVEAAHGSTRRDVHDVDAVETRRRADAAAGDVAERQVARRSRLVAEANRVVRRGAGLQVAGVVDSHRPVRAVDGILGIHEVDMVAIAIADAVQCPLARRGAAGRLDARIGGGAVFIDQAITSLDAKRRRSRAGRPERSDARKGLDLGLVLRSSGAVRARGQSQSLAVEAVAVLPVERDGGDAAVLRERAAAAPDRRQPCKTEAHTEQAVATAAVVSDCQRRGEPIRPRRQRERDRVARRPRGRHARIPLGATHCGLCLGRRRNQHTQRHHAPSQSCDPVHGGHLPWRRPARCRLPGRDVCVRRCRVSARLIAGIRRKSTRPARGDRVAAA